MHTADLISPILTIIAIFVGLRLLFRYVLPFFFKRKMEEMQKQMMEQMGTDPHRDSREEGDVKIEYQSKKNKTSQKFDDEYVDYEVIE